MPTEEELLRERMLGKLTQGAVALNEGEKPPSRLYLRRRMLSRRIADAVVGRHVDTGGSRTSLDDFDPELVGYEPSGWAYLPSVLPRREVGPQDVFLDYGCGAGRVVYQAARRYACRRVMGIDLSAELVDLARRNVERNAHRLRTRDVEIVHAEASAFVLPDDVTIAYFYFPFSGRVFQQVLDHMLASLERAPRRMRIVYAAPVDAAAIEASGAFRLVRSRNPSLSRRRVTRVNLYESA